MQRNWKRRNIQHISGISSADSGKPFIEILINGLKIVFIFHPLPTLPLIPESFRDSPPEGEGKGEGDHLCIYYYEIINNDGFFKDVPGFLPVI
ncbi:MAG: hypothetical protein L6290_03875 [Thermodesulfovibrionales bacterium]|nr:hypothetical protein [Thermodesulfovibrionales bacterium]